MSIASWLVSEDWLVYQIVYECCSMFRVLETSTVTVYAIFPPVWAWAAEKVEWVTLANVLSNLVQSTSREILTRRRQLELSPTYIDIIMNLKHLLWKFEQVNYI